MKEEGASEEPEGHNCGGSKLEQRKGFTVTESSGLETGHRGHVYRLWIII